MNSANVRSTIVSSTAAKFGAGLPRLQRRSIATQDDSLRIRKADRGFVVLSVLIAMLVGARAADADNAKPKEAPVEAVSLQFAKVVVSYRVDGSPGPQVTLEGTLHLASQALLSNAGDPVGFTLHTNLSNVFASSADAAESYVAVGNADGIPAECQLATCAPPFWMLTFRLVPEGSVLRPSLLFDLAVKTAYSADGTLLSVCIAGQGGCDIPGIVP